VVNVLASVSECHDFVFASKETRERVEDEVSRPERLYLHNLSTGFRDFGRKSSKIDGEVNVSRTAVFFDVLRGKLSGLIASGNN
jgi:hypothetical protein